MIELSQELISLQTPSEEIRSLLNSVLAKTCGKTFFLPRSDMVICIYALSKSDYVKGVKFLEKVGGQCLAEIGYIYYKRMFFIYI